MSEHSASPTGKWRLFRRTIATGVSLGTLAVLTLGGPVSGTAQGAVTCSPSWAITPSDPAEKDPRGIGVVSPNDVWVVGTQTAGAAKVHPATEHWDGTTWTPVTPPFVGLGESALNAVSVQASDDIWAVGYYQPAKKTDAAFHTLTEHRDGSSWSVVDSPSVGSGSNTLTGVAAISSHNVWAVGYEFDSVTGDRATLLEHFDGTSWSIVTGPNPGATSNSLLAVSAVSANDVWAVGFTSDGYGYNSLIEHWDGSTWSVVSPAADPGSVEDVLAGVSQNGTNDVWAFGYHVVGSRYETLTEHWDGSSWTVVPSANGANNIVTVLRGGSALQDDVWAVGFDYRLSDGRYKEFSEHWNGTSWTVVPPALATTKDKSEMYAVAHVPGSSQTWASGRSAHIETICPVDANSVPQAPPSSSAHRSALRTLQGAASIAPEPGTPYAIPNVGRPHAAAPGSQVAVSVKDMATPAGISENTLTHGAVAADFNNDGWPDLFINRHQQPAKLYINNQNGTFTLTDFGEFPHRDRHGCSSADVNGDGLLDIFCNTGSDRGTEAKRDELWIQQANGTFQERAAAYGVLQPFDRGRLSAFIDANKDGKPDVYAANFPDRADGMPSSNRLFINQGGTAYKLGSQFGLDQEINGSSISVGDYNNDGYQDLMVAGLNGIQVYRNDAGTGFTDVSAAVGMNHRASFAQFVDFNDDGKLDIAEVNQNQMQIDIQQGNGTFAPGPSESLQSGFKLASGDVNGDGMPDIYVEQANTSSNPNVDDRVFLNNGAGTGFVAGSIAVPPPSKLGAAEDVTAVDYDNNGLSDFLVQNGNATKPGTIQLIAFFPA
jgi:hypothetical protein